MAYRPIGYRAKKAIPAEELARLDEGTADATDSARKLAEQYNINLADITGSGVHGRITKGDVLRQAQEPMVKEPMVKEPMADETAEPDAPGGE